jgi:hypothetical protein
MPSTGLHFASESTDGTPDVLYKNCCSLSIYGPPRSPHHGVTSANRGAHWEIPAKPPRASVWVVDGRCACTKRRVILILAVAHTRPATASSYSAQLQPEEGTTSIGLEGQEHHPQDHARP